MILNKVMSVLRSRHSVAKLKPLLAIRCVDNVRSNSQRDYRNFGHERHKENGMAIVTVTVASLFVIGYMFNWEKLKKWCFPKVDAAERIIEEASIENGSENEVEREIDDQISQKKKKKKKKKEKMGFHDRKVNNAV